MEVVYSIEIWFQIVFLDQASGMSMRIKLTISGTVVASAEWEER
jgi:hypothetical protein